jgi:hypothetical protein
MLGVWRIQIIQNDECKEYSDAEKEIINKQFKVVFGADVEYIDWVKE